MSFIQLFKMIIYILKIVLNYVYYLGGSPPVGDAALALNNSLIFTLNDPSTLPRADMHFGSSYCFIA